MAIVILSKAKDLEAHLVRKILHFVQDDSVSRASNLNAFEPAASCRWFLPSGSMRREPAASRRPRDWLLPCPIPTDGAPPRCVAANFRQSSFLRSRASPC
jgi:hypothetical protein